MVLKIKDRLDNVVGKVTTRIALTAELLHRHDVKSLLQIAENVCGRRKPKLLIFFIIMIIILLIDKIINN
jgi:carbon starvation protein CstA